MTGGDTGIPPWTRQDGLVAIGAAVVDLIAYTLASQSAGWPVMASGILLLVVSALPLLARRTHPLSVFAAVLVLEVALRVALPVTPGLNTTLVVALYSVVRAGRPAATVAVTLATITLTLVVPGGGLSFGWALAAYGTSTLLVVVTGLAVNRRQRDLEANRQLLAARAVADERRRIARELHDIVAHHITVMQLMAGGARANLAHAPDTAREALITLEDSGRLALSEMRQLLDVLRADEEPRGRPAAPEAPQPGADDLEGLVAESRLAGLPTELSITGDPSPLPPTVGLTVFRLVQEGLTNTRKHAGRARAYVHLTYHPGRVTVEVRDDGAGTVADPESAAPDGPGRTRSGYGLIGMRERVALQGGSLDAGPLDEGGFRVAADLPLPLSPPAGADAGAVGPVREEARR
ncbi:sensor histidine kinase [Streptomyces sp. G-G2]|uniref:sensor histidine kinase n=1 Tax=Streptomyces sp. G-G2 TaxID=3046201 RepID=UPI0024B8CE3E|nr:sensor histidine kinase [Streptomyces sp. G-G2]MDJ0383088.1 sensor histidine kinase [Streptomyces sp. G-G2]